MPEPMAAAQMLQSAQKASAEDGNGIQVAEST